jgi:hypothetical protein
MTKLLRTFILAIGTFALACGLAYAADDTLGTQIDGSAICVLSVTSSNLSITAPTGVGASTTAFTNSPIEMELTDNDCTPVALGEFLTVQATSSEPAQYADTQGDTYYIELGEPTWTPAADNDVTPMDPAGSVVMFSEYESPIQFGVSPTGNILHGTVSIPAYLAIESGYRLRGDTSDSITIQFTFVDF